MRSMTITDDERKSLLSRNEDHFCDLKAKDIKPAALTKHISAFANSSGGELFIGIAEKKTLTGRKSRYWSGFADEEAANGHVQCLEEAFPLGTQYRCEFLSHSGSRGLVLHIEVQKTQGVCYASNKTAYRRRGASSLPAKGEALEALKRDKGVVSFESEAVNAPLSIVTSSNVARRFVKAVVPRTSPRKWMDRQLLVLGDKPMVAAVLLFAEEPQACLPKRCAIKVYRYKTQDAEGTRDTLAFDPVTVEGCLYDQIRDAVQKTAEIVEKVSVVRAAGLEKVEYPEETLHEIITNAVIHRDYGRASDIHIRVFDNRIEVESPGLLPGHVTKENILDEQAARNGRIVRIINKFPNPPNKDVGEGLNTAFQAMRKLRLKDPIIEELDSSVLVNIRHERLASPEEAVLEYLRDNDEITNKVVRQLTGIGSENKVKDVFYRLRDKEEIERVPGKHGSASAWRKKSR